MKNPRIHGSVSDALLRVVGGAVRAGGSTNSAKRPARQGAPSCESLEGRVVLSNFGGADLLGGLSQIGIVTNVMDAGGPRGGRSSQTDTAWQTLQTEIQGLAAKSDVTVADLSALASDSQAIAAAGAGLKADGLRTVLGSLAAAVAGGGDTTQAQADFNALFSGSKVDQATIDKTFTDLVQTIKDSNITTSDLTEFATAIAALPDAGRPMHGPGVPGDPGAPGEPGGINDAGRRGDVLTASLANAGVMALPTTGHRAPDSAAAARSGITGGTQSSQLQADLEKLRTDQQTVAAKSAVSSDDLDQLKTDSQNIMAAGFHFDPKTLQAAINGLVAAVAGGGDTTQAQADFNALFSGSKVDQATIDKTFTDLVQTIKDSNITADDASLIASDQAAVQADFAALPQGGMGGGPGGMFGGMGGMFGGTSGQTDQWGGTRAPDHATTDSTASNSGTTTSVPATSGEPVSSQAVSSDSGTAANNAAAGSTVARNGAAGGQVRGGARRLVARTMRGGTTARNTADGSEGGGVQNRGLGMTQQGGLMNRMRRR